LKEAFGLIAEHPDIIPFSGATDLALRVTKKHETLAKLLDLSGIRELQSIQQHPDRIILGAGVPLERIRLASRSTFPALSSMLDVFGSRQIRTLATLGGNLGSASPIGDLLPVLMAYSAIVELGSSGGTREISMTDFITGYRTTVRRPDELITRVTIPVPDNDCITRAYKISKRQDLDISTVSGGFSLVMRNGIVESALLAFGGMAAKTERADIAEKHLRGKRWDRSAAESAAELVRTQFNPISDARAGADFRRIAAGNLILKFWNDTK